MSLSLLIPKCLEECLMELNELESLRHEYVEHLQGHQTPLFGLIDDRMVFEMDIRRRVPELRAVVLDGLFCRTGTADGDYELADILELVKQVGRQMSPAVRGRIEQIRETDLEIGSIISQMNEIRSKLSPCLSRIDALRQFAADEIADMIRKGVIVTVVTTP